MGLADRHYHRRTSVQLPRLTPVVKALLWINGILFLLDYLIIPLAFNTNLDGRYIPLLVSLGGFTVESAIFGGRIWEFLTFQFLHGSVGHLLFNSIGLFFFGPWAERWWGSRKFLIFYLLCGCGGAGFYALLESLGFLEKGFLIGASAGIYGIFISVAVVAPEMRVRLLIPPIELSMRQLAISITLISIVLMLTGLFGNQGGEAGHLGGLIAGYLLMKFPWLLGAGPGRPKARRRKPQGPPKLRPRTHVGGPVIDPEIDRILDKISKEGIHAVTAQERELLRKLSQDKPDSK